MPSALAERGRDRGCGNVFATRNRLYKNNSFISVEAEMGMEGQIMCIEKSKCTY